MLFSFESFLDHVSSLQSRIVMQLEGIYRHVNNHTEKPTHEIERREERGAPP